MGLVQFPYDAGRHAKDGGVMVPGPGDVPTESGMEGEPTSLQSPSLMRRHISL